jgi:hypothetical protein
MLSLATAAPFGNAQCERSAAGQQRRLATDGQARERRAHSNPAQRCSRNIKRAQERPFSESEVSMTRAEVFALTVKHCDAVLEEQLEAVELLLRAHSATVEEVENAIGPHGYARRMLCEDRDAQLRQVAAWLSGNGNGTLH